MYKIRKASINDISAIYSLISYGAKNGKVLQRSKKEVGEVIHFFYVAVDEEKIVGCVSLEVYSRRLAEVRSLVVDSKHQNKGIGKMLIKQCLDKAKQDKIKEILAVTDKVELFEKCGFYKELDNQWPMFIKLTY